MPNYVAGFAFDLSGHNVLLIRKEKPEWQRGKLNGIGGKIEEGESEYQAMVREFHEETGYLSAQDSWENFLILSHEIWKVHFFRTRLNIGLIHEFSQHNTVEPTVIISVKAVHNYNTIPNLRWLIPLALDKDLITPINIWDKGKN